MPGSRESDGYARLAAAVAERRRARPRARRVEPAAPARGSSEVELVAAIYWAAAELLERRGKPPIEAHRLALEATRAVYWTAFAGLREVDAALRMEVSDRSVRRYLRLARELPRDALIEVEGVPA